MELIKNKTIEQMAQEGYEPILGAVILFSDVELGVGDVREEQALDKAAKQVQTLYHMAYPNSNKVADAFVIKTKMISTQDGVDGIVGRTKSMLIKDVPFYAYPVLAYAKRSS